MLHPARVVTALVVLALTLAVRVTWGEVGAGDDRQPSSPAGDASRHNTPVTQELTQRWRMLEQLVDAHAGYSGGEDWGVVTAYAVCGRCNRQNIADRLVRDIWWSDLQLVTTIKVSVAHEDDRGDPLVQTWEPAKDAAVLYDRFGNGLVDPDDLEGG